jgi:hypothetical protein
MHYSAVKIFRPSADQTMPIVAVLLAALVLVFLLPSDLLLSARSSDMTSEFVASRAYLAENLRAGHLPLWNPFTYSGQPFLAGFESAVLYPVNLVFLVLPLARALNFSILLHLVILGWGMGQWALSRSLHPWAAGLAASIAPLSGAVFPHVYAGHLSNLCTMAWVPWTFLGLESFTRHSSYRWLLLASAAACLQILAGQVQYCFFVAVAAGLQAIINSALDPVARRRALPAFALCYMVAAVLSAAQLLPSMSVAPDVLRDQKLDYSFAAMFGFQPENFLTMIAPAFFGGLHSIYWGHWFYWEMSLFIGASGLVLIGIALSDKERKPSELGGDLILVTLLLVIALGIHTPLFKPLYEFFPGLGYFRGWSKFIFPATLFLILIIARGTDVLLRGEPARHVALSAAFLGLATMAAGVILIFWPRSIIALFPVILEREVDFGHAGTGAGLSLALAGLIFLATGTVLLLIGRWPFLRWGVPTVLIVEMLGFAGGQLATSHLSDAMPESLRQFIAAHPGDYRVLNVSRPNNGFLLGASDLAGNNPVVLRRYAEFMTFSQGDDPNKANHRLHIRETPPSYSMLRLRYIFTSASNEYPVIESPFPALPRVLLVSNWQVLKGRDAIFSAISDPSFDPSNMVLMESAPEPPPEFGAAGSATVISALPDALTIEVNTDKPTLLLVTDLYESGWRAEPLPGSAQQSYQVMPADYILRVVPLMAGHHRLRLVYSPYGVISGISISVGAWLLWTVLFYFVPFSTKKKVI